MSGPSGPSNYGTVTDPGSEPDDVNVKTIEELYDELGLGKAQYFIWCTLALVIFSDLSELVVISTLIPYLRCEWDLDVTFEVAISCSVFFFYALGGVLFGTLSDIVGRRKVILITTTILFVASLISAASPNKWIFLGTRAIVGLCIGANLPTTIVFAAEVASSRYKEYGIFILLFTTKFAMVVIALVAFVFLNAVGWRVFLVMAALPVFLALDCLAFLPESPRFLVASGQDEKARDVLKKYFKWNGKSFPENIVIKTYKNAERGNISDVLKPKYLKQTTLLSLMYFGNIFIIYGLIIFLPLALATGFCGAADDQELQHNCTTLDQGDLLDLTIITAAGCIAVICGVAVAKKIGRKYPIKAFGICVFILTLILYKCIHPTLTKVIFFLVKFFTSAFNVVIWIIIPELYPTVVRNTATGFINFWGKSGGALSTALVYVLYYTSPFLVISMFVGAAVVSLIAALLWNIETKDAIFEEIIDEETS